MKKSQRRFGVCGMAVLCAGVTCFVAVGLGASGPSAVAGDKPGAPGVVIEGPGPLEDVAEALLSSSAPTGKILHSVGKFGKPSIATLLTVIDKMREHARIREDRWGGWGHEFPGWWVPRPPDEAALREALGPSEVALLRVFALQVPLGFAARYLSQGGNRHVIAQLPGSATDFLKALGKAGGSHWLAPAVELRRGEVARLALGWTRAFLWDTLPGIGRRDVRHFDGLKLSLHAPSVPVGAVESAWTLDIGAEDSELQRPVGVMQDTDLVIQTPETFSLKRRPERVTLSAKESSWLLEYCAQPDNAGRVDYILVCGAVIRR